VKSRVSPRPPNCVKISAFPAPPEDRKLTYRHATFSISVDELPFAIGQAIPGPEEVRSLSGREKKLKASAKLEDFAVQKTAASRKASPTKRKKQRRKKR
jgi:hypothetical protein